MGPASILLPQMDCHGLKYMCMFSSFCTITFSASSPCLPGPITHPPTSVLATALIAPLPPPFQLISEYPNSFFFKGIPSVWPVLYFVPVFTNVSLDVHVQNREVKPTHLYHVPHASHSLHLIPITILQEGNYCMHEETKLKGRDLVTCSGLHSWYATEFRFKHTIYMIPEFVFWSYNSASVTLF